MICYGNVCTVATNNRAQNNIEVSHSLEIVTDF